MKLSEYIQNKRKVTIGYLGGSITAGSGSSNEKYCWRYRVTQELGKLFPDTGFEGINAAIGGTDSSLGLFRMDSDMMQQKPDMVFVEFAVNDCELQKSAMYMENIVRQLLKYDKDMPVVFIYTVTQRMIDEGYSRGELPESVKQHNLVAEYYNIPVINAGKALFDTITEEKCDIYRYTIDSVHPNDDGYALYTNVIMKELPEIDFNIIVRKSI